MKTEKQIVRALIKLKHNRGLGYNLSNEIAIRILEWVLTDNQEQMMEVNSK